MLELVGLGTDVEAATAAAELTGGTILVARAGEAEGRPFTTLIRAATDNVEAVAAAADVGLHVAYTRAIKPPSAPAPPDRVVAAFVMVAKPGLTHRQADDHWRDVHGPVALRAHRAMCDYHQVAIVGTLAGSPIDGIALCAFPNRDDLRHRFFVDDDARAEVAADVASFADLKAPWPRVVMVGPSGR